MLRRSNKRDGMAGSGVTNTFGHLPPRNLLRPNDLHVPMIDGTVVHSPPAEVLNGDFANGRCPECGWRLVHRDGCIACLACGYSTCG